MKSLKEYLNESSNSLPHEDPKKATKLILKYFDLNAENAQKALKDKNKVDEIYSLCADNFISIYYNDDNKAVEAAKKYEYKIYAQGTGFIIADSGDDSDREMYDLAFDFNEWEN